MTTWRRQPLSRASALRRAGGVTASVALMVALLGGTGSAAGPVVTQGDGVSPIVAVDEQDWSLHDDMTWDDYVQVRPDAWNSPSTSQGSEVQYQGAVILLDFDDQPFVITQPADSHLFGNPQAGHEPVATEDVADWMLEFLNEPNEFNNGQGIHAYWMEDTHGKIGVDLQTFGPYRLSGKYHEYGGLSSSVCPAGDTCNRSFTNEGTDLWRAATGCESGNCGFDFRFLVTAGHDETSTWHEFGEMMFETREDVPDSFGPPRDEDGNPPLNNNGEPIPNWSGTRYVDWTSWLAASNHWPSAGGGVSRQAENSGIAVYAHEFSHIRGLPDNYGNPYDNSGRMPTAHWEMMSRGSFNGPGGVHSRWQIPNAGGSSLGPHHMLRFKQMLGVIEPEDQVLLERDDLLEQGVAVATVKSRSAIPDGDQVGLQVAFGADGDLAGSCADQGFTGPNDEYPQGAGWCPGTNFHHYSLEVVDQVGNDSFAPGHGVLIAKSKNTGSPRVWIVDSNPENFNLIDFYRPVSGEPVPMTRFDPRQLNDATFHAGTLSDSEFEYVDEANNLHFYVVDAYRDADGALLYDMAVRNLAGAGAYDRDVSLGDAATYPVGGSTALVKLPLTNTGEAGEGIYGSDVYRVSAEVDGAGWDVHLPYEVTAAAAGETVPVPVYATATEGAIESATVTVTATSESDPDATVTFEVELTTVDLKVTFDSASALVDAYLADGLLHRSEYQQLLAQLNVAERTSGQPAHLALDRFVGVAEDLADAGARNLASAALVSLADDLRDEL